MIKSLQLKKISVFKIFHWSFLVMLFCIAAFTELFYNQTTLNEHKLDSIIFPKFKSENISSLILKNRFHILRLLKDENGMWFTASQKNESLFPVKEEFSNSLLSSISSMTMQKQLVKDQRNLANFSLSEPLITLVIEDSKLAKSGPITMKVGISNPVTNSSYVYFDHIEKIFQVDMVSTKIINFQDESIYDERVFAFTPNGLLGMNFTSPNGNLTAFNLNKNEQAWYHSNGKATPIEHINSIIRQLKLLKNIKVIQNSGADDILYKAITKATTQPYFKLTFVYENNSYQYMAFKISGSILSFKIPEVIVVEESSRPGFTVMAKADFESLLNTFTQVSFLPKP
jgi:hypothetical protein